MTDMEANTQKLVCVMDTLTTKKVKTMSETKNLEWAVKHPKWVVEHGIFLDNYPGSDDYNIYQVYEEKTNVTTLFVVAFENSLMEEPVNCYPLTQIGGKPL